MTDLELAIEAATKAGELLRQHFGEDSAVDEASHHDIKLALDKESQELITGILLGARSDGEIVLGVIHDPMMRETWTVEKGSQAYLNGKPIQSSPREKLEEAVLFVGCGKDEEALSTGLERFKRGSLRARKMRMMGSAALGMAYIACGRLDSYVESRISLWDIAAGQLLVETAGGKVELTPVEGKTDVWSIVASNGKIPIEEIL